MPVAATATAMLWTEIILPITPAAEFTDAVSTGLRPSAFAVTTCRLPNSAFADVSLPVRNTPSQPRTALKNGNAHAGRREREPERGRHARVVHQVRQAEHRRDRQHRELDSCLNVAM